MENTLITVKQLHDKLNSNGKIVIGFNALYNLVRKKDFPSLKIGGKFYIIENKVDEWLSKQAEKFWC